jgi:excisionase family DNA binding protein
MPDELVRGEALGRWYKTAEIAETLRVTPRTVQRYIKDRRIKAIVVGGGYRIEDKEFQRFTESLRGLHPRRKKP